MASYLEANIRINIYGYRCKVPRNRGPNVTLLTSMTHEGMGPRLTVEGATTREVFEVYI